MGSKRKVCVVTGSRAEYGYLKPLLEELAGDRELVLQLIVTGMHLSREFGLTYRFIEKDGFPINEKVDISLDSDTSLGVARSAAAAMVGLSKAYRSLMPDIIVLIGDRFEIFSAAFAAHISGFPIAHISGGEVTEGVFDEAFRHSITKMSQIHFTYTQVYRKRVIQLGESSRRVYNVGAPILDTIKRLKLLTKKDLEKELKFKFNKHNLLVTFHPVTLQASASDGQFRSLLAVLDELKDTNIIFTKSNADTGGRNINRLIDFYVSKNSAKAAAFTSMGQLRYFSAMQFVDGVVGNSYSGIIEAPSFKIGTINIGDRQKGRIKAESVIDCQPNYKAIKSAVKKLYGDEFREKLKKVINPFGDGNSAKRIVEILKKADIDNIIKKSFYDINFDAGENDAA